MSAVIEMLPRDEFLHDAAQIGDLLFMQLTDLRHRGAFSTVAQTFALLTAKCGQAPEPSMRELLNRWQLVSLTIEHLTTLTMYSVHLPL